jgi:hypothetical protein
LFTGNCKDQIRDFGVAVDCVLELIIETRLVSTHMTKIRVIRRSGFFRNLCDLVVWSFNEGVTTTNVSKLKVEKTYPVSTIAVWDFECL